jgi:hypothetical protein
MHGGWWVSGRWVREGWVKRWELVWMEMMSRHEIRRGRRE